MARTSSKVVASIPKTETGAGVFCKTTSGQEYTISQCLEKEKFTLWKSVDGGFEKISTANSPLNLYENIPWES